MKYEKQVGKDHYSFEKYFYPGRWMSYWYQTKEVVTRPDIQSVLDIGSGSVFFKNCLQTHRPDIEYKTLDIAADLRPDLLGSVTDIPAEANAYDAVCAFQVLEHIDFKDFEQALAELNRVSRQYVFISLPHFGPIVQFDLKLPFMKRMRFAAKPSWPVQHKWQGQHYWEIGKRGYSPKKIRSIIAQHLTLLKEYIPFENQYHHFYIARVKQ
jgi:ubiquinone/menaquinone biosynthesis C-methylase UbiE